jgi:hypothetical protein
MLFVVPFDGGELSEAALTKAKLYAIALEEAPRTITTELFVGEAPEIVAVSVIPEGREYAQEKGWITQDEEFRARSVAEQLHHQVVDIAPSANFQSVRVDRFAPSGTIGNRLRAKAVDLGATDVFIGSENAGKIVNPITSAGRSVAADERYDVHIVRRKLPPKVRKRLRSEFYLPE